MSAFSDSITSIATGLITEFGESVAFARVSENSYNVATSKATDASTLNYSGFGVPVNYSAFERTLETIEAHDVKLTLEKTTTEPQVGDLATLSSKNYRVVSVSKSTVSGADIIYTLQLRTV